MRLQKKHWRSYMGNLNLSVALIVYNEEERLSKTLESIINSEYFNSEYLDEYLDIEYHDKDNFLSNIDALLTLGYTSNDINLIYNKLNDTSINIIINNAYLKDLSTIINLSYFKEDNLVFRLFFHYLQ